MNLKENMDQSLERLKEELRKLRTSRANPAMLSGVMVNAYNSKMALPSLAHVSVLDSRTLSVAPFDEANLNPILKAIEDANLGISARIYEKSILIGMPQMSEEVRESMGKRCREEGEKTKVKLRQLRHKENDLLKTREKNKEITKDELDNLKEKVEDETKYFCGKVDSICLKKIEEIGVGN